MRRYLDLLTQAYLIRQLQPWFVNLGKRQVKAPKIYLRDSGLLHSLLGIARHRALVRHPKSGASWEGFALDQVLRIARPEESTSGPTHAGAELDPLMIKEVAASVSNSSGRRAADDALDADRVEDLGLDAPLRRSTRLTAATGLHNSVEVVPLAALPT